MKKTMRQYSFTTRLKSLAVILGTVLAFASCANEDIAQNPNSTDNDKNLTTFTAGDPTTRTSMETDGKFFWEAGDRIWVKDDNGVWRQSSNAPTAKTASFKFKVPGKFTQSSTYKVYYPGQNGNQDQVTISASQSQEEPNTTTHFGTSGDCGMADASKQSNGSFAFTLDHKAAYLLFLPRTTNTILQNCYLTKVEINSDNDITDTYTLNPTTGELTGTGTGKQIIVSTGGSGTYANGFPLTNTSTSAATNGAYVVIKPGTHTLKIRYWVKDIVTNVEGTITKTLSSATYDQNKYYNITANLNIKDYDGDHYYMWDAQEQYWKGYEWTRNLPAGVGQPTISQSLPGATTSSNYAQSNTDPNNRWYKEGGGSGRFDATQSCATLPNANELSWYAMYGDPRWDRDELWTTMGHLYKGGMWFKKKAYISGYNGNTAVDGTDWCTNEGGNSWPVSNTLPSAADAGNYFYLPALGYYTQGMLYYVGESGRYWSSSADPSFIYDACYMHFNSTHVTVMLRSRNMGLRVDGFE